MLNHLNLESYQHQIYLLFPLSLQRTIKFDLASPFYSFHSDQNSYILSDILLRSIAEYFYEFWRARRESQNTNNK